MFLTLLNTPHTYTYTENINKENLAFTNIIYYNETVSCLKLTKVLI